VDYAVEVVSGPITGAQWHALATTVIARLPD
jgi:hypothetical protein